MHESFVMKPRKSRLRLLIVLLLVGAWSISTPATALDIYEVDPEHSFITFRVKHLGITFVFGRFNFPVGTYALDSRVPENCFIDIKVRAADIDTGNAKRDEHLRSPDFFDVALYPEIIFRSVFVDRIEASSYRIIGHLTLHGITQFVTVDVLQTGEVQLPSGETRTGFETTFTIHRSQFGMKTMMGGVADKVELTVAVEGYRKSSQPLPVE